MENQQEELLQRLRNLIPINGLQDKYQKQLVKQARLFKYPKGKIIFKQGERDGYSYYLLKGQVELDADGTLVKKVVENTEGARNALAQLQPRQMSARSTQESVLVRFDRDLLNQLLALDAEDSRTSNSLAEGEDEEVDWMTAMLESELFSRIPAANIQQIFSLMEEVAYEPGGKIIQQGEPGDYYYIIQQGRCMVLRTTDEGKEIQLAELTAGDSFGEEALVSDSRRNASVVMLTRGSVMRLTKEDFAELIKKPVLNSVSYEDAVSRIEEGEKWLDIRFKDEHVTANIPGSINIPLNELRQRALAELNPEMKYIVYSDVGSRASVAAYLLSKIGIDVSYLKSGFENTPFAKDLNVGEDQTSELDDEADSEESITEINYKQEQVVEERPDKEVQDKKPAEAENRKAAVNVGVRAASLKADLAKADMKMQEVENLKKVVEAARKKMETELEEKLRREREKMSAEAERVNLLLQEAQRMQKDIAVAKELAEKEVQETREQEEARIRQLQAESERRLRQEEAKLEEVYARNTEELLRVQQRREEAAAELERRNHLLEQETAANRQELEEARRLKQEAEMQLQMQAAEQEKIEQRLRKEAEERIRKERKKLEGEFAITTQQLQQAQRAREDAEIARRAATEEAEEIIRELKTSHNKSRELGEEKLRQEKQTLEEEARRIREELHLTHQARQEAEAARGRAEREVEKLSALQEAAKQSQLSDAGNLQDEINAVEAMAAQAREQLESAVMAEKAATNAQIINTQQMKRTEDSSAELRKMVEDDIGSWMEEQERFQNSTNQREENIRMMEQMKRIAKRAEIAMHNAKKNEQSLFDDLASFREGDD